MNDYEPIDLSATVFKDRYAIHPDETFDEACYRVAESIAANETGYKRDEYKQSFHDILRQNRFSPGGRIWRAAGRPRGQYLNCFMWGDEMDSREGWGDVLRGVTIISSVGGGVGINLGKVRPRGTEIKGTGGISTGSVSLMRCINAVCNELRAGGGRRCLPKDTLIHTKRGLIPIKDIKIEDEVQTLNGNFSRVIAKERTGQKPLVIIDTQMGLFYSSENHRWAVLKDLDGNVEYVKAKDLKFNDRLVFLNYGINGLQNNLPHYSNNDNFRSDAYDINIPPLSADIAWLLGQLAGDGCVKTNGKCVSIVCPDNLPDRLEKIVKTLKLFGNDLSIKIRQGHGRCKDVVVHSVKLNKYFSQFKQPNTEISVPDCILCSTRENRAAYIAGVIDSDGCLKTRTVKIANSIYPKFLHQLRAILSSLGISSRIKHVKHRKGSFGKKALYELNVLGRQQLKMLQEYVLKFSIKFKIHGLHIGAKDNHTLTVPKQLLINSPYRQQFHRSLSSQSCKSEISWFKFQSVVGDRDFQPIKVKEVKLSAKIDETYDIQVENDEMFIAEGLLVHNSALLFVLPYDHPDIPELLEAKLENGELQNANISVGIDQKFLDAVANDEEIILEWMGQERGRIKAEELWNKIIKNAWECGDPGLLNLGYINKMNSLQEELIGTNPCSEIPLSSYQSCCLGSIVLPTHVVDGKIDWDLLKETVQLGVRFLDNVLDINNYPMQIIKEHTQRVRRIGLGIMGLHDLLILLGVKYSSSKALEIIDELMDFIKKTAYNASIDLAIERGPFPGFDRDSYTKKGFVRYNLPRSIRKRIREHGIRNATLIASQPTGTTSIVAGCSSGIEPIFALAHKRRILSTTGTKEDVKESIVVHPLFKKFILEGKSIKKFEGAHDITPRQHCAVQVACQKHICNSISKTINIPNDFPVEELDDIIWENIDFLKGITIYRDGSKGESPLMTLPIEEIEKHIDKIKSGAMASKCSIEGGCDI